MSRKTLRRRHRPWKYLTFEMLDPRLFLSTNEALPTLLRLGDFS